MKRSAHPTRRLAATAAGARIDGGHGTRRVELTVSAPVPVGGDFACDPADATRCAGTFRNERTLTGDFAGTAYQVGTATLLPDGTYQGAGIVVFTGTVDGCGFGTLVIVETGRLDPASGAAWGTWAIEQDEGSGDLADLTGTLSSDTRVGEGMEGTIRCD